MSFDIFFQGFLDGSPRPSGGEHMAALVHAHVVQREASHVEVVYGDGGADLYLTDEGMMANHVRGTDPWDLLVRGAAASDWVIIPVGCAVALTGEHQRAHLPDDLAENAHVVQSFEDLLALIRR